MRDLRELDEFRRRHQAYGGSLGDHGNGYFELPSPVDGETLRVIAANGGDWDHVSVSRADRCPTWAEMDWVARRFFQEREAAMQLHVPADHHINRMPHCLHLWRPRRGQRIPRPPAAMV